MHQLCGITISYVKYIFFNWRLKLQVQQAKFVFCPMTHTHAKEAWAWWLKVTLLRTSLECTCCSAPTKTSKVEPTLATLWTQTGDSNNTTEGLKLVVPGRPATRGHGKTDWHSLWNLIFLERLNANTPVRGKMDDNIKYKQKNLIRECKMT